MAIVKLGDIVVGVRGTVAGVIYSANKAGPFARAWSRGSNPQSPLQQTVRGQLARLGQVWQGMTQAQRDAWDALAVADPEPTFNSLGEPVALSGFGYFCRTNVRRQQVPLAIEDDAPTGAEATQPASLAPTGLTVVTPGTGASTLTWNNATAVAGGLAAIWMKLVPSVGAPAQTTGFKLVGFAPAIDGTASSETKLAEVFGEFPAGWTSYVELRQRRLSGLDSTVQTISAEVT